MSSTPPESEFDLEKLFLPAWAQNPPAANKYASFSGEDRPNRRMDDRGGRRPPPRRDGGSPGGDRSGGRPQGGRGGDRPARPGGRPFDRNAPPAHREPPPPAAPLPQLNVTILPDEKVIESLARQIRMTGRAYPLFDIARLILQKPERQQIRFETIKKADGQPAQPLYFCALDDTLWLSTDEAVNHVLNRHFDTFYKAERTPTDPPRGTYTFVAQCGLSGAILGPPNHHDYQNQLRKLHAERFARMPFESFKARVKIVKDEAVVKKWIEDQSFKTEFTCLNVAEPLKLGGREEVEKHFREVHLGNIVKTEDAHTLSGVASRQLRSPDLQRLLRLTGEEQRRFPLKVATTLSQQFAGHGLQFFKVNRTLTHVSVARPHYLDLEATPVSEGVKRIVDYINQNPRSTRRKLLTALAPLPVAAAPAAAAPVAPAEPGQPAPAPAPAAAPEPSPEQTAVASDLHWLIHQGHVIEFANGILETAKKPLPRPPRPERKTAAPSAPAEPPEAGVVTGDASAPGAEPAHEEAAAPPEASEGSTEPKQDQSGA